MLRTIFTASIIVSQLMASVSFANAGTVYYYRHNESRITGGLPGTTHPANPGGPGTPGGTDSPGVPGGSNGTPEDPSALDPFVARNIRGDSDVAVVGAKSANLTIALFNPKTGQSFSDVVSWEQVSGTLPEGVSAQLSADMSTLTITGIPKVSGEFGNIVYRIKDNKGNVVTSKPLKLVSLETTLILAPWPDNVISVKARSQRVDTDIAAVNVRSDAPLQWTVTGVLPEGVTYHIVSDVLKFSGVAEVGGDFKDILVTARDSVGRVATVPVEFHVTSSLETVNSRNEQNLDLTTGVDVATTLRDPDTKLPYTKGATWTQNGALPKGVVATLSADRSVMKYSGVPTESGFFKVMWLVDDGHGNQLMTTPVRLYVGKQAELEVVSSRGTSVHAKTNEAIRMNFTAQNTSEGLGIPEGSWSLTGNLPAGLSFSQDTEGASISGTPQKPGNFQVTVTGRDYAGKTDDIPVDILVADGLEMSQSGEYAALEKGYDNLETTFVIRSSSASSNPYVNVATSWDMVSGKLPSGIKAAISSDRSTLRLSGIPTETGFFGNIIYRATDAFGNSYLSSQFAIQVNEKKTLQLVREGFAGDMQTVSGIPFDANSISVRPVNTTGTVKPGDWEVIGLPEGLSFETSDTSLTIKGVPKQVGSYAVRVNARDSVASASIDFSINVVNGLSSAHYNPVSEKIKQYSGMPQVGLAALVTATNAPYTGGNVSWSLVRGTLPPGISMAPLPDGSVLRFKGYSDVVGVWSDIVFRGTDVNGNSFDTKPFTFTVEKNNDQLVIDGPASEVNALADTTYSAVYGVSGLWPKEAASASNWTIAGIPEGIKATVSGNGQLVYLDGAFKKAGTFNASLSFQDSYGRTASYPIAFKIQGITYEAVATRAAGSQYPGEQGLEMYTTPADIILRLRSVGSNIPYTGGATWALAAGNSLPKGLVGTPSADGSRLEITGYATAPTSGWHYVTYVATLKDGTKLDVTAGFFAVNVSISLGENQSVATPRNVPFYTEFAVTGFGAPNPMTRSSVTSTTLPAGLSIRVEGNRIIVEGTPTTVGKPVITLTVTDQYNRKGTGKLTMNITAS